MSTRFQAAIFLLCISGLSGVALAQQLQERGTEDPAASAIRMRILQERMRIPGPVRLRHAAVGCEAGGCGEPPKRAGQVEAAPIAPACSSLGTAQDRRGRPIRRLCAFD